MSYVYDNLLPEEKFAYEGKVHSFYVIMAGLLVFLGFLFLIAGSFAILFGLALIVYWGYKIIFYLTTEIVVTNKRVIYKTGFIARNVFELQLNKVESAYLNQTVFERIIGAGTLVVSGTGGHNKPIQFLDKPTEMRTVIYERIES